MSLQDIHEAIKAQADEEIATLQREYQHMLRRHSEENEREIAEKKRAIRERFKKDMTQERIYRSMQLSIQKRNILLQKKQEILSSVYNQVIDRLCTLTTDTLKQFLFHCIQQCPENGIVRPVADHARILQTLLVGKSGVTVGEPITARGGFLFITGDQERDFTFEHLVFAYLRPATEVEIGERLFSSTV